MREAYEFLLHATIVTCNESLCDATLVFARDNTYMLVLKQDWISVALSYLLSYKKKNESPKLLLSLVTKKAIYEKPWKNDEEVETKKETLSGSDKGYSFRGVEPAKPAQFKNLEASDILEQLLYEMNTPNADTYWS
jgi:hypothetical protein